MPSRRDVLGALGALGGGSLLAGCAGTAASRFHLTPSNPTYTPGALVGMGGSGPPSTAVARFALRPGEYTVAITEPNRLERLRFQVRVVSGGPIDVVLFPSEGADRRSVYRSTSAFPDPLVARSVASETEIRTDSPGPRQLVLDNSAYGATFPSGAVRGEIQYGDARRDEARVGGDATR